MAMATGEKETVLVTGAAGFIGSNLVDYLRSLAYKVVIFDVRPVTLHHHLQDPEVVCVQGDITRPEELATIPGHIDWVVHLAAAISVEESMTNPHKYEWNNVQGSRNVYQWALDHNVRKVVSASSAAVYGNVEAKNLPVKETLPFAGISPYATSKQQMESLQHEFSMQSKGTMAWCALRFFNVFGPRQDPASPYTGVISKFFDFATAGKDLTIFGDGGQTRDFVYVRDVARACVAFLEQGSGDVVFNVGTGRQVTITELAETVKKVMASPSPLRYLPPRDGDIRDSCSCPDKLRDLLGWVATTSLEEGLKETAQWFRSRV